MESSIAISWIITDKLTFSSRSFLLVARTKSYTSDLSTKKTFFSIAAFMLRMLEPPDLGCCSQTWEWGELLLAWSRNSCFLELSIYYTPFSEGLMVEAWRGMRRDTVTTQCGLKIPERLDLTIEQFRFANFLKLDDCIDEHKAINSFYVKI